MESMPQRPNHGSATVGSSTGEPNAGSGATVQFNPNATDFFPQVPPYPSSQQPIKSTSGSPSFTGQHSGYQYIGQTKDQHAGYQYTGQGFGAPIPGPGPMAAPPPAAAGQTHQWPPTFSGPPGGPSPSSFSPPNAGPPFAPPMAGSLLSQPPSFPAMGSKALVSGSFPMPGQMITPGDQTAISGPSPGYSLSTGNVATSQRTAPIIQTTGSGSFQTPGPTATHINPAAISESFQNLVNPTSVGEQRGPPSFGSVQASTPASYPVTALSNLAPAPLGFLGDRELSNRLPPYRPEVLGQAPPQFRASSQPGLHPSQYPQYGGQPHMTSTYADGGSPYPVAAPPFSGNVQGLVEEFQSLSMATVSGSMEARVDPSTLPRPSTATEYPAQWTTMNCNPRYLRLTCGSLPNSHSLVARWHLPLGAVVHPLAEAPSNEEVPVVDFGTSGIARCRRCRTYINPYAVFTDNGRRWKCNLCGMSNEVPSEYYCPLDENGRRRDADERPELSKGSVEFIAPAEYMVRPPMPPVYFFLIDVSSSAVKTGMLQIAVDTIKSCLDKLPGYPRTQIGFLTFDSTLHFYCLKSSLTHPQMMVVADLDDPFLPMPDDLLVNLSESRTVVEVLLDSLPSMFENNLNVESAAGPALRAVYMIMSQLGGKLLFFQSTLPSLGVGRLKLRGDDPRIYGTDREPSLRNSEDSFYKQMAADFSKFQIGVNLYAFPESHIDLVSLGTLAKYTGGQVYYYPSFQPYLHREKFSYELARDLTRETAWEAVMRIRCGKGVRFNTFHGHFMLRSSDLMALPAVDCDKAFAMQLTLEDTLLTSQMVYFQVALLFTSSTGERRIRIHTLAAPVVSELSEMYHSADTGSIMMLMSRLALEKSLVLKLEEVRQQSIQVKLVRALREYRNMYAVQHRLAGRLIYPDSLKLLPLYCLALYKCLALRGGYADATLDERAAAGFDMMVMSVPRLLKLLYPSLVRLDDHLLKGEADIELIQPLPLTAERLDPCGAFLVNDGLRFIVWLGKVLPADFVAHLLGMEAVSSADLMKVAVSEQDNDLSKRFMMLLKSLRESNRAIYQQCLLISQGDQPREGFLVLFNLVEDRTSGSMGYADWMMQIYQQVLQKR